MALLYETVPAFEDTWIECLGDVGRYRMGIEDDNIRDRETWTSVSRHWYSKASDKAPTTGRFYHHLEKVVEDILGCFGQPVVVVKPHSAIYQVSTQLLTPKFKHVLCLYNGARSINDFVIAPTFQVTRSFGVMYYTPWITMPSTTYSGSQWSSSSLT
ncbi:hypothetical protein V8F33_013921 [Rhypophila sp. PSN 637]